MTNKAYQSKLAVVEVEIARLRAKRPPVPYRQIACDLHERFGIKVDAATVFRFVKVRSKGRKVYALPPLRLRRNLSDSRTQESRGMTGQRSFISRSTESAARAGKACGSERSFHEESTLFENFHSRQRVQPNSPIA